MSRYFINTTDRIAVLDDEGTELPDLDALRSVLRRTLAEIMRDEDGPPRVSDFSAEAYDEGGKLVMSARASFSIVDQ